MMQKKLLLLPFIFLFTYQSYATTQLKGHIANRILAENIATDLIEKNNFEQAIPYLQEHLVEDATDFQAWILLANTQQKNKQWESAQKSFYQASQLVEGQDRILSYYASASAASQGGDAELANNLLGETLETIKNNDNLYAQVDKHRQNLKPHEALPDLIIEDTSGKKHSDWSGNVSFKSGYDSNVLVVPDSTKANLAPDSVFYNPTAQVEYTKNLKKGVLSTRSNTSFTGYIRDIAKPYNSLNQSLVLDWAPLETSLNDISYSFGNQFDISFLNSDGLEFFSWSDNLYANGSKKVSEKGTVIVDLPLGYQSFANSTAATPIDDRSGIFIRPGATYLHQLEIFALNVGLSYSDVFAEGDSYKSRGLVLSTGLSKKIFFEIQSRVGFSWGETWYHKHFQNREDSKLDLYLTMMKSLPTISGLNLVFDASFTKNDSSINTASYDRSLLSLQVAYEF